jgi:hypothetical protein
MVQKENSIGGNTKEHAQNTNANRICRDEYTNSQIIIHNIPLISMYILGTIIIYFFNLFFAMAFIIYLIISNVLFMVLICTYCPHYGSRTSLCGYGLVSKRLASRKRVREFSKAFKRYIAVLFPNWFAPLFVGIYLLWISFEWIMLILLIAFILIAFIGVLYVSKSESCNTCRLKNNCPWMSICSW